MHHDPVILLVAYSVFAGYQLNPAEEIARTLDGDNIVGLHVKSVVIPVSYSYVKNNLARLISREDPGIVVGLGLAPRAQKPTIELAASNVASFRMADEEGSRIEYEYLHGSELEVVPTRLPVKDILVECEKRGIDIAANVSIGTYLCGVAGYIIMRYAHDKNIPGGFVHVPPTTELAMRHRLPFSRPLNELVSAVKCILETTARRAYAAEQ